MNRSQVKAKLNRLLEDLTVDDIVEQLDMFFSYDQLKEFADSIEPNKKGDNNYVEEDTTS